MEGRGGLRMDAWIDITWHKILRVFCSLLYVFIFLGITFFGEGIV